MRRSTTKEIYPNVSCFSCLWSGTTLGSDISVDYSNESTGPRMSRFGQSMEKHMAPSLIMVDPFGFTGMPYRLIAKAASQPRSEFLISFMYESVVRWRNHPDHVQTFDSLFGCPDWRRADDLATPKERKTFLIDLYLTQLRSAGMQYARGFEMLDTGNRTEYFLIFATHSIEGLKAMKAAMWKVDPTGRFEFSDATVSSQLTLFAPEPSYQQLRELLVGRFAGRSVSISAIEEFVVVETAFRETHYKRQILAPMERAGQLTVV
ncbi:MAG: three-Cys-motif partner protein TcmP, partial [Chloroflexi bacterium]